MKASDFLDSITAAKLQIEILQIKADGMASLLKWSDKCHFTSESLHSINNKITGLNNELMQMKDERARRIQFLHSVPGLSDDSRRLLIMHYVDELPLSIAAKKLFYSASSARHLHKKAVAALDNALDLLIEHQPEKNDRLQSR